MRNSGAQSDETPQDDAVIGVALRRSLITLVILAGVGVTIFWMSHRPVRESPVVEVELQKPAATAGAKRPLPQIPFTDITNASGIGFHHENGAEGDRLLPETMGGGVAIFDMDADGHLDLLFVNSMPWPWSEQQAAAETPALYRNLGDGTFEDVTAGSGLDVSMYGMGVAVADYDGDGHGDVFLTAVGANRLFHNLGDGSFREVTETAGVAGDADRWSTSAAFIDYDRDGDLDLFVANYVEWARELDFEVDYRLAGIGRAYGPPSNFPGTDPYLYRNDGQGRFSDVSAVAGVRVANPDTGLAIGKGLAVMVDDLNEDGWPEIVVANDTVRNFLFLNRQGRFEEAGVEAGLAFDNSGNATGAMGIDGASYANDVEYAVAIGNFANEMTSFFVDPDRSLLFTDEAIVAGVGPDSRSVLSFGLFFFDADLDGYLDLLQVNGHVEDDINIVQPSQHHSQPPQLFWNCGPHCPRRFSSLPGDHTGDLTRPMVGRGATFGDLDGDGDLDVVLTQTGGVPRVLRNDQAFGHHWLRVRLSAPAPNTAALGARLRLSANGQIQERRISPARSYLSQIDTAATFGLGAAPELEALEIIWPDGMVQTVRDLPLDKELLIERITDDAGEHVR